MFTSFQLCLLSFPLSTHSKSVPRGFPSPPYLKQTSLSLCWDSVFSSNILSCYRLVPPGRKIVCPRSLERHIVGPQYLLSKNVNAIFF